MAWHLPVSQVGYEFMVHLHMPVSQASLITQGLLAPLYGQPCGLFSTQASQGTNQPRVCKQGQSLVSILILPWLAQGLAQSRCW